MSLTRVPTAQEAEEMADALIENIWSSFIHGYRHVPIDPIRIANEIGIRVFDADLPDDVSGQIVRGQAGGDVYIYLNRRHAATRARFTCAHELGHYMLREGDEQEFAFTDYRGPLASTGQAPEEVFANQFAAALLMPAKEVREEIDRGTPRNALFSRFQVSPEAMKYRLINLGLTG